MITGCQCHTFFVFLLGIWAALLIQGKTTPKATFDSISHCLLSPNATFEFTTLPSNFEPSDAIIDPTTNSLFVVSDESTLAQFSLEGKLIQQWHIHLPEEINDMHDKLKLEYKRKIKNLKKSKAKFQLWKSKQPKKPKKERLVSRDQLDFGNEDIHVFYAKQFPEEKPREKEPIKSDLSADLEGCTIIPNRYGQEGYQLWSQFFDFSLTLYFLFFSGFMKMKSVITHSKK
jgi:hypothetical protein